ncbi:MAG: DUF2442 domain-containing protein [Betaproteobacteria bacterium]|nr:DUF2442 domain-containing protein [Candidatus Dechloromonas phosphorivorans]
MTQIEITGLTPAGDYRLRLIQRRQEQEVDFLPFLISRHPAIRAFLAPERFATYRLEYGDLVWGDFELCFPIVDLYENHLLPTISPSLHEKTRPRLQ